MNRREVDPDELKELYVARMTHEEMAERLGVSAHVIGDRLRELGLRTDIARHLDIDEISRLFDSGMSVNQISKRVGYSRKTITKYLADAGREMRSHVEAGRLWTAKLTQEERNRLIANAQASQRGQKQPFDLLCKKAKCREANMFMVSRSEVIVREWLEARGLRCTPQKAVGPYNIDVAVEGERIAVEIFGGNWHATGKHAAIFRKRTDYLIGEGWLPVFVWVGRAFPLEERVADYVADLAGAVRRGDDVGQQERMIRGDGKPGAIGDRHLRRHSVAPRTQ